VGTVRRPEEQLHRAVVQLLQVYQSRGLLTFCHVPNGGWRKPIEAAALKAMSTTPGVPDLLVWLPGGGHFQVELKAGNGRLSAHQSAWISRMTDMGVAVHVIRSLDGLEALLRAEGVPPVGTLGGAVNAKARGNAAVQERAR
jgi:hypothetical protein